MGTQTTGTGGGPSDPTSTERETERHTVRPRPRQARRRRNDPSTTSTPSTHAAPVIPDEETYISDPTGFEPTGPEVEVAGRRGRLLTRDDLARMHVEHAGNLTIQGTPNPQVADEYRLAQQRLIEQQRAAFPENQADALMPDFLREAEAEAEARMAGAPAAPGASGASPPSGGGLPPQAPPAPPAGAPGAPGGPGNPGDSAAAVAFIREAERARQAGDPLVAARLQHMAESALAGSDVRRRKRDVEQSSILGKLRRNLGLERIPTAVVENWGGLKWHFAPAPAPVDYWMYSQMPDDALVRVLYASALGVSANLVGLDDTPIYKVLNVPTTTEYEITVPGPPDEDGKATQRTEVVNINLHVKHCPGCNVELERVDMTQCNACGAQLDPMLVPPSLRVQCAEAFYIWLQEDFGPFEKLEDLWRKMNQVLTMRSDAGEDMYPLLDWSENQQTTPDSPPGEES